MGLPNKTSRSGYGALLERAFAALGEAEKALGIRIPVGLKFGQVDVEFVDTYRRARSQQTLPSQAAFEKLCIEVSQAYLSWVSQCELKDKFVLGINPPCLTDKYIHEAYVIQAQVYLNASVADEAEEAKQSEIISRINFLKFPSQPERTDNSRSFNSFLKNKSQEFGVKYFDNFDIFIGRDNCTLSKFACASDGVEIQIGLEGKDIHIGGKYTLAEEAKLIRSIVDYFAKN
jgi:hypothetical protein